MDTENSGQIADFWQRALNAAGSGVVLLDTASQPPRISWVNEAFTQITGYRREEVAGETLAVLEIEGEPSFDPALFREAARTNSPVTWRMKSARPDGTITWLEFTLTAVREPRQSRPQAPGQRGSIANIGRVDGGLIVQWVCLINDVSAQVAQQTQQQHSIALERTARTTLDLVSLVSDLLTDTEYPFVLREISSHLQQGVAGWAGFFLDDGGLTFSEGIKISPTPSRARPRSVGGVRIDPLGDPMQAGKSTKIDDVLPSVVPFIDSVQNLLDGIEEGPINFVIKTTYPRESVSAWLAAQLIEQLGISEEIAQLESSAANLRSNQKIAIVHAVPGRRKVLGLMVTTPSKLSGAQGIAGTDRTTLTLLHVVARRVGMAIDNVRLYSREHRLAETLQRAMLPEQVEITGLDVWTYYAPTSEHAQVGGDWYDVLPIEPNVSGLVIGDVVGHDIEAAATMGQLRSVVRSYAYELITPSLVLERTDHLVRGMKVQRSASCIYATLKSKADEGLEGHWEFSYSRAGHLPPLLLREGHAIQLNEAGGPLIGFGDRERQTAEIDLVPGDTIIFYTDGLFERRDRSLRAGLSALTSIVEQAASTDAAGIGEELISSLADAPEDDVAVVVVRVPDPTSSVESSAFTPRSRRWLLPSEPASIARARQMVINTCRTWELDSTSNAELVVSELVANGVLHGWGHLALRLFDTGDGLRIEVEDANPAPPVATEGHANRMGGFGMQIVSRLAEWGWRPTGSGKVVWARIKPQAQSKPNTPSETASDTKAGA